MATINDDDKSRRLVGTQFDDVINGNGGDDILIGGLGADLLNGGSDDDTASYEDSFEGVIVQLGEGGFSGGNGGTAQGDRYVSIENVTGSAFDDHVFGDGGDNVIDGGGGRDSLFGGGGVDYVRGSGGLFGGDDDDELEAVGDDNTLFGGAGRDTMYTEFGSAHLDGGAGFDTVDYGRSFESVTVLLNGRGVGGFAEGDTYESIEGVIGSDLADTLSGDDLGNRLDGGDGGDLLKGFGGADTLEGGRGEDTLQGGEDNDFLIGGEGADEMVGGGGVDTADYRASIRNDGILVSLAIGAGSGGDAEGDTFQGVENVAGTLLADTIIGDGAANALFGDVGNDTLSGGDGADRLEGQSGADVMIGGDGDDTFVVEDKTDVVYEVASTGIDTVRSSIGFDLSNSFAVKGAVENVTLTGTADVDAGGSTLANLLIGNGGENRLNGSGGADTMRGMGGDDIYTVENAGDVVDESIAGSGGSDEVRATVSFSLTGPQARGAIENLDLLGNGDVNGVGNGADNDIDGNNGRNDLMGMGGDDILTGRGGADVFVFSAALNAATNVDTITDFDVAADTIRLENAFMQALGEGQLKASAFHIGAAAADASDRIVYNSASGALSYDADGTGAKAAIKFAQLDDGLSLTFADFLVV